MRDCSDLKHSMANLACGAETPIRLISWYNVSQISQMLSEDWGDWVLRKESRADAYKQLPSVPDGQSAASIALIHPGENRWYGFFTRTLIFGSVPAVLRYNGLSRMIVALVSLYLGIPLVGTFDDIAAIIRATVGQASIDAFARFCSLWGSQLKEGEFEVGPSMVFLGLVGPSPCVANGGQMLISLPEEKRAQWPALIRTYPPGGRISHRCLGKMIGRLSSRRRHFFWEICPYADATAVSEIPSRGLYRPPSHR